MPIVLRVAHVDEVPPGTSLVGQVRGRSVRLLNVAGTYFAFDAAAAPMGRDVGEADLAWARQRHAPEFRAVVHGTFVHVAMDSDRQQAPAAVQSIEGPVQPVA